MRHPIQGGYGFTLAAWLAGVAGLIIVTILQLNRIY